MAFLQLKSTNPQLSYIIKKNPESGVVAKGVRKGIAFGYFSEGSSVYNVYFQDGANEISYPEYKDQEFEYVNATRYSSTNFIINVISDFLRDPLKKLDEQDTEGFKHTITVNLLRFEAMRMVRAFEHHFSNECEITLTEITNRYYRVTFTTEKSIHYLLNLVNLFCCFITLNNEHEYIEMNDGTIERYFLSLAVIDSPYFIRYAFKADLLRSERWFRQWKTLLEKSDRYSKIELDFGSTVQMRLAFVRKHLSFTNGIVDVGCGEGTYLSFASKIGSKCYYAIDIDEGCRQAVKRRAKNKNLTNVQVLDALNLDVMDLEMSDFLLCEVLEHMPIEEAEKTLRLCLLNPKCNSVIITTPNKDFNFHYFEGEHNVRRSDHFFEFTEAEFGEWLKKFEAKETQVFQVGDIVEGKPVSLGAVLRR